MNDNWKEIIHILKSAPVTNKEVLLSNIKSCLRLLGWKETNGSMKTNYPQNIFLDIDIALVYPNKTSVCLPVFAKPFFTHTYLNETFDGIPCKAMILIGDTIDIYWKDTNSQKPICVCNIPLSPDSEVGVRFINLLQASNFNETNFYAFCEEIGSNKLPVIQLRKKIEYLIHNPGGIKSIIKDFLVNEDFDKELVEQELQHINFYTSKSSSTPKDKTNKNDHTILDNTRFSFDNIHYHSKRQFVLLLIKKYVEEHPNITYDDLERVFPSRIISKSKGVVRPLDIVKKWIETQPDLAKRYNLKSEDIITLKDGMQVVVNNQWGTSHFPAFLEIAKTLYNIKSDKPYEFEKKKKHSGIKISPISLNSFIKNKRE